jgi:drug/metabolite transporter (DMT)-like permease
MAKMRFLRAGWMALLSGLLGATASCFAKFAFDPDSVSALQTQALCEAAVDLKDVAGQRACYWVALVVARGLCLACMIACNAYMLGTFLKGMEESGSVAGTALSTASNFVVSACYGYILWGERFSVLWWTGFGMVITGVLLLSATNGENGRPKRD